VKKLSLIDHLKNEEVYTERKERNILPTIERSKANWIGHTYVASRTPY